MSGAKRIRMILMVVAVMVAMLLTFVVPAFARPTHYFFIPEQRVLDATIPALTFTCDDTNDPINIQTCQFVGFGKLVPGDLICDVPVTLVFEGETIPLQVFQCRTQEATEPLPPAPITQESEQGGDSGEIDQSFGVS